MKLQKDFNNNYKIYSISKGSNKSNNKKILILNIEFLYAFI